MSAPRKASSKRGRRPRKADRLDLDTQLAQLENAQLIRRADDPDLSYLFKHTLSQETAYGSLLVKRRCQVHLQVAQSIERLYADRLDEYAAILARHYAEAGDDAKTLEYATRAGDAAMRIYANVEAVGEFSLALEVAKRMAANAGANGRSPLQEIYLKRGRALELLSRFEDAASNYGEMETAAVERGDRASELAALIARATVLAIPSSARDPEQARVLSDRALGLARELGDRKSEAKILWNLLLANVYADGDAQQAVVYGEQSLAIAREFNLREQMAYTMNDLWSPYASLGELEKAGTLRLEAGKIWREFDNRPMLAESLSGLSILHFLFGEFDQAISLAQEAYQISQSIGNIGGQGFSGYALGQVYLEGGEFAQAIKSLGDAIPITQVGGMEGNGLSPSAMLGLIHGYLGDLRSARDLMQMTFEHASTKLRVQRIWLYAVLTRVELLAGDLGAAEAAFREGQVVPSLENFRRLFPAGAPNLHFAACELALAQKDYGGAIEVIDSLLAHLREIRMRAFISEGLHLKGQALFAQGQTEQALATWHAARAEAEAIGSRRILWRILQALSQVEARRGNRVLADELDAKARATVEYIAAHTPDDLRVHFLNLPDVRRVLNPHDS